MHATNVERGSSPAGLPRAPQAAQHRGRGWLARNNTPFLVSGALLVALLAVVVIGGLAVNADTARTLSAPTLRPPSWQYPLGTDKLGRNLLAVLVVGTPNTFKVGLIAGLVGVGVATVLACAAGYYGGAVDLGIRWVVDVGLTVPGLLVLLLIAIFVHGVSVEHMALVIASLAWMWPTRTLRSQVLTLRRRAFVEVAHLSGMSGPAIIVKELVPNLVPLIAANFVATVSAGILASIGLEALGLGPAETPTLGMTIYWVMTYSAVLQGQWWWWAPPIAMIVVLFVALFGLSRGLDQLANPRLRHTS
jgi:peptide/nickel transport system permease protein